MRALIAMLVTLSAAAVHARQQPPTTLTPGAVLLRAGTAHMSDAVLTAALAHADPAVRAAGARVISVFAIEPMTGAVAVALERETDPRAAAEFVRALLFLRGDAAVAALEPVAHRLGAIPLAALRNWRTRIASPLPPSVPDDLMFSRTMDLWLPGLLTTLSAAANCRLDERPKFGYVRVTYRRDGRPLRIATDAQALSKECGSVLAAIGRTTLAEDGQPVVEGHQQWIVVPFSTAFAKCTDEVDELPATSARIPAQTPPKKIKDVKPEYPPDLRATRVQGVVTAQGWISTRGCVTHVRITRSAALGLELAALRAMTGWEFEPARRDGRPIPVWTMLTMNFSLR